GRASIASTTGSETKLIRAVHSIYRRWAYFIVDYSYQLIALCTILTVLCTIKIAVTPQVNDITGYTPYGARSRDELAVRSEFFDQDGLGVGLMLLMLPKQGNNMLVDDYLKEVTKIDDFVMNNISIYNDVKQQNETFSQYCKNFCKVNEPITNFYKGFHHQNELLAAGEQLSSRIQLNYPVTFIYGRRLNIQVRYGAFRDSPQ
ncbi:patched family protein, partial [Aphelenchoides avenae]